MGSTARLDGIEVLDLSTVGPAARAGRLLADYGALVTKVGAPAKAGAVQIEPPFFAYSAHRGMARIRIDLKDPAGVAEFLDRAATSDVVIESFRPGVVDRLGIGYDAVRARNPRIVYCSTSGYGQTGPKSRWAGHDLNYLGVGGYLHCSARDGSGVPALPGATIADIAAGGMHAGVAILTALLERERTGEGTRLDVSVADGVLWMLSLAIDEYLAIGEEPGPGHNILTGRFACYGVYACGDGKFVTVAAIEPAFWANLCRALKLDKWIAHQHDDAVQDAIRTDMRAAFATRDRDAWIGLLAAADTCVAPVYDVAELVDDEHFAARNAFVDANDPFHGDFRQVGPVLA